MIVERGAVLTSNTDKPIYSRDSVVILMNKGTNTVLDYHRVSYNDVDFLSIWKSQIQEYSKDRRDGKVFSYVHEISIFTVYDKEVFYTAYVCSIMTRDRTWMDTFQKVRPKELENNVFSYHLVGEVSPYYYDTITAFVKKEKVVRPIGIYVQKRIERSIGIKKRKETETEFSFLKKVKVSDGSQPWKEAKKIQEEARLGRSTRRKVRVKTTPSDSSTKSKVNNSPTNYTNSICNRNYRYSQAHSVDSTSSILAATVCVSALM